MGAGAGVGAACSGPPWMMHRSSRRHRCVVRLLPRVRQASVRPRRRKARKNQRRKILVKLRSSTTRAKRSGSTAHSRNSPPRPTARCFSARCRRAPSLRAPLPRRGPLPEALSTRPALGKQPRTMGSLAPPRGRGQGRSRVSMRPAPRPLRQNLCRSALVRAPAASFREWGAFRGFGFEPQARPSSTSRSGAPA
jgi:hypothetical protein